MVNSVSGKILQNIQFWDWRDFGLIVPPRQKEKAPERIDQILQQGFVSGIFLLYTKGIHYDSLLPPMSNALHTGENRAPVHRFWHFPHLGAEASPKKMAGALSIEPSILWNWYLFMAIVVHMSWMFRPSWAWEWVHLVKNQDPQKPEMLFYF